MEFNQFVQEVPLAEIPLVLSGEFQKQLTSVADPLPVPVIKDLMPWEEVPDEMTEILVVARFEQEEKFQAMLYWKAELLTYSFVLVTYNFKGEVIDHQKIAGTTYDKESVVESVAIIEDDWMIFAAEGDNKLTEGKSFEASKTRKSNFMVEKDGRITKI
ncbi:MAG TPA: hypothetical protein VJ917_09475 [Saprospiraceae bacterium]|nr:hypothetical protein [Saprospiraceae bacterium]